MRPCPGVAMALPSRWAFYTEQRQGWMAHRADARSWRSNLHGYRGLTLWTAIVGHAKSGFGTEPTKRDVCSPAAIGG
jgi:hypothetical protein